MDKLPKISDVWEVDMDGKKQQLFITGNDFKTGCFICYKLEGAGGTIVIDKKALHSKGRFVRAVPMKERGELLRK